MKEFTTARASNYSDNNPLPPFTTLKTRATALAHCEQGDRVRAKSALAVEGTPDIQPLMRGMENKTTSIVNIKSYTSDWQNLKKHIYIFIS